jgi:anti-sigma B factor antagonist
MTTRTDDVALVNLRGEADLAVVDALLRTLAEARGMSGVHGIAVDLTSVTFIDSSGLGALIAGYRMATQDGLTFEVRNPTPAVRSLLAMTGVLRLFAGDLATDDISDWP